MIRNSQQIHKVSSCCLSLAYRKATVMTVGLESSIVIVVGVTLALIDKGRKKNLLPEGTLSSLWQRVDSCSHNSLQTESESLGCKCVCCQIKIISLSWNASLVIWVHEWPHLCDFGIFPWAQICKATSWYHALLVFWSWQTLTQKKKQVTK